MRKALTRLYRSYIEGSAAFSNSYGLAVIFRLSRRICVATIFGRWPWPLC